MARSQGEHAARSGPSPARGLCCCSGVLRGAEENAPEALGLVAAAGVALLRYSRRQPDPAGQIEPERRVPRAYQTLGNFPSLPPAAACPANPFTQHPQKGTGHYNPLSFNFPTYEAELEPFSCFTLNHYGVPTTLASPICDFSQRKDEIKPSVPLVVGPHCPSAPPHHLCRCWVQKLLQDILRAWPDLGTMSWASPGHAHPAR